jgi:predicted signal transduction protein with EAL and GGDEF domain
VRDATDCELFARKFCEAIAKAQLQERQVALAVIHFDALPSIMSAFGSAAGRMLVAAALDRISTLDLTRHVTRGKSLRATQMESDQLAVLIEGAPNAEAAARVAEIIFRSVAQTVELDGQRHALNPTIGLALFPDDGREPEALLDRARGAILEAHRSGRQSRVATASETATSESILSTDLEKEVRWAVQGEQFVLQYAPVVELVGRRTVTLTTSLRWDHPMCGLVPPEQFMPLLDKLDLRSSVDRWILGRASRDLAHWSERGSTRVSLGIKLTHQAMATESFFAEVAAAAAAADIRLSRFDFDIDSKTLATGNRLRGQLRELRNQGARVFLEDFGADGIGLGRLRSLPLDGVKIAPEFVAQLDQDAGARAVCSSAVSIARSFGLKCVAVGVTTRSQLDFLYECNCEFATGPLLGSPQPASELPVVVADEPPSLPLKSSAG